MPLTIPIAHDFSCPWCWVGFLQSEKLCEQYGIEFEWRGYELWPSHLERPVYAPQLTNPNKPVTPDRFQLMLSAERLEPLREDRPKNLDTHIAHEAVEYAKTEGVQDALIAAIYRALYEQSADISDPDVLLAIATPIVQDLEALKGAISERRYADQITEFDAPAYNSGVFNVPTFFIGEERYAEQPLSTLKKAIEKALNTKSEWEQPVDRPLITLDMVATIDGKILSGGPEDSVQDLGSKADKAVMRRLGAEADAVIMGANTLRATPKSWSPKTNRRLVVSKSGDVPLDHGFLTGGPSEVVRDEPLNDLVKRLHKEGVKKLLLLGGSELNAQFFSLDLIDEIYLTVAPKVKLGRDVLTVAGGDPLAREALKSYELIHHYAIGDELFLRYRRKVK